MDLVLPSLKIISTPDASHINLMVKDVYSKESHLILENSQLTEWYLESIEEL